MSTTTTGEARRTSPAMATKRMIKVTDDKAYLERVGGKEYAERYAGTVQDADVKEDGTAYIEGAKFFPTTYAFQPDLISVEVVFRSTGFGTVRYTVMAETIEKAVESERAIYAKKHPTKTQGVDWSLDLAKPTVFTEADENEDNEDN